MSISDFIVRAVIDVCNEVYNVSFGYNEKLDSVVTEILQLDLIPDPEYLEGLINRSYQVLKDQKPDQCVVTAAACHYIVAQLKMRATKETRVAIDQLVGLLKPLHNAQPITSARRFTQNIMIAAMLHKRISHPNMCKPMLPSEVEECLELLKEKYHGILERNVAQLQKEVCGASSVSSSS